MQVEKLKTIDADTLLSTPMRKTLFVVDGLIPQGLSVLSGSSKIGKSWLMLWLGIQVARGQPVWEFETHKSDVLYLCLEDTYARIQLLSMVDDNKIAFNPAVEISYLDRDEQLILLDAINMNDCTPSHAQSIRLKKMSQDGLLTADAIYAILSEEKPNQKEQIKLPRDELRKYFPQNYSDEQIKRDILKGLELLKRQRERNRDAR